MIAATTPVCTMLLLLLLLAVASDLRSRRIPNALVLVGLGCAVLLNWLAWLTGHSAASGPQWWTPLAGAAAGLGVLMPLYLLNACGAGDVKLMAMVGAFIGPVAALTAAMYTIAAGGLLSLVFMFVRGVPAQTLANVRYMLSDLAQRAATGQGGGLAPLDYTAARLPYAVAIALGTGAALIWPLGR
jgi:prepilin peptidase CpaA